MAQPCFPPRAGCSPIATPVRWRPGGIGTALAAIYVAAGQNKRIDVFVDETRPLLQGSRLTAWELQRAGVSATVLVDGAAASLMRDGSIDLCIVGADRIARNGDVVNKIGTYPLAIAARHHGIPFYVAAPASSFDASVVTGRDIVIEQRSADEVRACRPARDTRRCACVQPRIRRHAGRADLGDHYGSGYPPASV